MSLLEVIGWVVWGILLVVTLWHSLGHYNRAVRKRLSFNKATPRIIAISWILVLVFVFTGLNKLHILWLYPVNVFIIFYLVTQKAIREAKEKFKDLNG